MDYLVCCAIAHLKVMPLEPDKLVVLVYGATGASIGRVFLRRLYNTRGEEDADDAVDDDSEGSLGSTIMATTRNSMNEHLVALVRAGQLFLRFLFGQKIVSPNLVTAPRRSAANSD